MHKLFRLLPLVLALALLCACTTDGTSIKNASPTASENAASPSEQLSPSASPSAAAPIPASEDNEARCRIFRTFLSDNYKTLSDAFNGDISGICFLDLDCDRGIEMVLFDAGASAALGAEFFDITPDGNVVCVSSNLDAVGKAFRGKNFLSVTVNANRFDDFRLMEGSDGSQFFVVQSGNGARDFKYTELVRFGHDENDILTLESLCYDYQEMDDDGNVTSETWKIAGKSATKTEYDDATKAFAKNATDMKYTAKGVSVLDSGADYESSSAGLQQMAEKAYTLWDANKFGYFVHTTA